MIKFTLPSSLVAGRPPVPRDTVRLMVVDLLTKFVIHTDFSNIPFFLRKWTCVYNNSKLLPGKRNPNSYTVEPIYASMPGGWVIPSAGIPFTKEIWGKIDKKEAITLCMGERTVNMSQKSMVFSRVTAEELIRHDAPPAPGSVAIGTTAMKAMESYENELVYFSDLYIEPGRDLKYTSGLLTNFHFPGETYLDLVACLTGEELLQRVYEIAIEKQYEFGDFGDRVLFL